MKKNIKQGKEKAVFSSPANVKLCLLSTNEWHIDR